MRSHVVATEVAGPTLSLVTDAAFQWQGALRRPNSKQWRTDWRIGRQSAGEAITAGRLTDTLSASITYEDRIFDALNPSRDPSNGK